MTAAEIITELKKFATAQTKKTWMTHGAQEPCLGGGGWGRIVAHDIDLRNNSPDNPPPAARSLLAQP